jgi:NADPH:quinone reductase-like Zn-dependent oxidoreductase
MKAIAQDTYGSADVLEFRDVDEPEVGKNDVLVLVKAAGLDAGVWHLMTGRPYFMRLMGFGFLRPKKNPIPGREVAGIVETVGAEVAGFRPGDEVMGVCDGSFAEYVATRPDWLVPKPANLTFEQAAVLPISGLTALQAVRDEGRVQPGQKVLIIGAGGGVGTFAVQIAKAFGAEVTGVCSTGKVDLVRSIGADHVIDYTREDFTQGEERYDLIGDNAGRRSLSSLRRALTPKGALVIVGGEGGGRWTGGFFRGVLRAPIVSLFVGQRLGALVSKENQEDLQTLGEMLETVRSRRCSIGPTPWSRRPRRSGPGREATRAARPRSPCDGSHDGRILAGRLGPLDKFRGRIHPVIRRLDPRVHLCVLLQQIKEIAAAEELERLSFGELE